MIHGGCNHRVSEAIPGPSAHGCGETRRRFVGNVQLQLPNAGFRPGASGGWHVGGAEGVVHAVRTWLEGDVVAGKGAPDTPKDMLLSVDFSNAFNTVSRQVVLDVGWGNARTRPVGSQLLPDRCPPGERCSTCRRIKSTLSAQTSRRVSMGASNFSAPRPPFFCSTVLHGWAEEAANVMAQLSRMGHAQADFLLSCFGNSCRFTYSPRTTPPDLHRNAFVR